MLLIWDVKSAADAKNYYASCFEEGQNPDRHGYYSEGQESPGIYSGKLADMLGIGGQVVDKSTFDRLCDNLHPTQEGSLTQRTNENRRVCKDFTFSGPKSFSIVEAFAGDAERRRLLRAFDDAVAETIAADIEPDMQTRVRIDGADHDRVTGNALTASFDHATARPEDDESLPDMHRHKHVLVWNATFDPVEGRIKAGQVGDIVRDKGYYQAAFFSRLADKLDDLGYVIDRRANGGWEIAGVPQSAIDTFSKRTALIEKKAKELKVESAKSKSELGAKLRSAKQKDWTLPELREAWAAQLSDDERDALQRVYARDIVPEREISPEEAVRFAVDHCSEQQSVISERELKRVAMLHGLGSVTPEQVSGECESPLHGLITRDIDGRRLATTRDLQNEERFLAGFAAKGQGAVRPVGISAGLERGRLNDGQWEAVSGVLASSNRVNMLLGPAGAGKTDLLKTLASGFGLAGKRLEFFATSSDAVDVLRRDGFDDAKTVAHLLLDEKLQQRLQGGHIVCDEASMLGHKDAVRLFELAEKLDLKILFVGDSMQHGSVSRGAFLRVLADYGGVKPFRLSEIMRQKQADDANYQVAAKQFSQGDTLAGFQTLDGMGWVQEIYDDQQRCHDIAADYVAALNAKKSVLVVSPTHKEAAAITQEIRSQLRAAGKIGDKDTPVMRLVPFNASEAERGQASTYRGGELVAVFHQNAKGGFKKGDRIAVSDAAQLPLAEAAKFSLFKPEADVLAKGDVIRFTGTVKEMQGDKTYKNGQVRTVREITKAGNLKLDDGHVIAGDAGHWRHGRVETSFGSQGKTVQRVILGMSSASLGAMNQEQAYVSASRGKERVTLYTDDKQAVAKAIERSSQKLAALDLGERESVAAAERLRVHLERQRLVNQQRRRVAAVWQVAAVQRQQQERQESYGR